jgi:hypothetical protein
MRSHWILVLGASLALAGCANLHGEDKKGEENEGDEVKIKFTEAPAAVQATINKESGNAKVETLDKETDDGKTIYEADAMINGTNYEIKVAPDGKLISKKIDNEDEEKKGGEKEEKEDEKK